MQCQQAGFFPTEIQKIIRADLSFMENGTLFEDILDVDEKNFVFWNVALRKFLIKLTGMIGVANVALLLQNQLTSIKNTGTTVSDIKKVNDKIFTLWQKIPPGNTTPLLRQTYTMQALDNGSPQAVHFAAALRQNINSARMIDSHSAVMNFSLAGDPLTTESIKWFSLRLQQTYQAYNEGTWNLPLVVKLPAKTSNSTTTVGGTNVCKTCGFSHTETTCKFWENNGPKIHPIAYAESTGNCPFQRFLKGCPQYQKMSAEKKKELQIQVAQYITLNEWPMKGPISIEEEHRVHLPKDYNKKTSYSNQRDSSPHPVRSDNKPATMVGTGFKSSSKSVRVTGGRSNVSFPSAKLVSNGMLSGFPSLIGGEEEKQKVKIVNIQNSKEQIRTIKVCNTIIRKVNSVGDSGNDSLLIVKGEVRLEGLDEFGIPIKAQLDAGSEVTIMEKSYAEGLGLLIEDRSDGTLQGVNGVGNGVTQWITQDAVAKIRFAVKTVVGFNRRGKPIEGEDIDRYVEVVFRFGLVDMIGTPCIIGADSLRSLDANHYYNPDKLVIQGEYAIECMSLDEAQTDARLFEDPYWSDIFKEEIRQVNRVKTINNISRRTRLSPGKAAVVMVDGYRGLISKDDVSLVEVINNPLRKEKFKNLRVRAGFCCGEPIVTLINIGVEPITVYRNDIRVKVSPRKIGFQMLQEDLEEVKAQDTLLQQKVAWSSMVITKDVLFKVKVIPTCLIPLMTPRSRTKLDEYYSYFDLKKQVEMVTELLDKSDIYEGNRYVSNIEWLGDVKEEFKNWDWKIYDPEIDGIDSETSKAYVQAVRKLLTYMKEHGYKTERNVLLAQPPLL